MSLQCSVSMNYASCTAGQTPPPMATVQVYNPNASAVAVTGIRLSYHDISGTPQQFSVAASVPPIGPGQTVVCPTLSSITFGPFPVVVGSASNANSFAAVNQVGNINPVNPQQAEPMQFIIMVGASVYGSDGSLNAATKAGLLVSYSSAPPLGYQGGFLMFAAPNNLLEGLALGMV